MTSKYITKRALCASFVAMLLCFSMLLGTTYAWFTDSVTSANNVIQSGTLNVEMYWAKGTEDPTTATWEDASETAIFNYDNWEPGYVEVRHIKIANEGTLALKYQLRIIANGEVSDLTDVIDVYYVDPAKQITDPVDLTADMKLGTLSEVLSNFDATGGGKLAANTVDMVTLALKMQDTAGNAYQGKSIGTDFSVLLTATQLAAEEDSFDNQYDKDAKTEADQLRSVLANAKPGDVINYALTSDAYVDSRILIPKGVTLNLDGNGHTMYMNTSDYALRSEKAYLNIKDLTINGSAKSAVLTVGGREIVDGKMVEYLSYTTMENVTVELSESSIAPVYFNGMGVATLNNCTIQGVTGDYNGTHIFVGAETDLIVDGNNTDIGKIYMNANYQSTTSIFASSFTMKAGVVDELTLVSDGLEDQAYNVEYIHDGGRVNEVIKVVETGAELESVLKEGYSAMLRNDITLDAHLSSSSMGNITIYGEGNTLSIRGIYSDNGANVTLCNMTLVDSWINDYTIYNQGGKIELKNVIYTSNINKAFQLVGGGDVILTDCNITGDVTGTYSASNIWCGDGRNVTVNGGTYGAIFINASEGAYILSAGKITVNDGTVGKLILETEKNKKYGDGMGYKSAILVHNGGVILDVVENPQNYDLTGLEKLN
ncbi:MAG: hypothetical protein IJW46_07515 [Clostridia bacterium]|nr:hypothetical protein [Clostridia bacterium]